jgi:hypothetical protein
MHASHTKTAVVAIVSLVSGATLLQPESAITEKAADVIVRNTVGEPVPVTVQGVATVQGAVTLSDTPTVNVQNTASTPLLITSEPPELFQKSGFFILEDGQQGGLSLVDVPAGKRLVLQYVSAETGLNGASITHITVTSGQGTGGPKVFLPLTLNGPDNKAASGLVQLILLNTFAVTATRSSSMGAARVEWTLSGYLTEIPSGVP